MTYAWDYLRSPAGHALMLAMAGTAAAQGLLAVRAAKGKVHWFWRALAVLGGAALLIPIRAYELAMLFALAGGMYVAGFRAIRWRKCRFVALEPVESSSARLRFGLRDLFLLLLLFGLCLGLLRTMPREIFQGSWTNSVALVGWAALLATHWALACGCAFGSRRKLFWVLLVAAVLGSPPILLLLNNLRQWVIGQTFIALWALRDDPGWFGKRSFVNETLIGSVIFAEMDLLMVLSLRGSTARRAEFQLGSGLLRAGGLVLLGWLYLQMLWFTPLTKFHSVGPNHYEEIISLAQKVPAPARRLPRPAAKTATRPATRPVSESQAPLPQAEKDELFEELSKLLDADNYVVLDYPEDTRGRHINAHRQKTHALNLLARLLDAEADAASTQNEFDRAGRLMILRLRLLTMLGRGDTELEAHEGTPRSLVRIRNNMSPEVTKGVVSALNRHRSEREPLETILRRGQAVMERADGWKRRFIVIFRSVAGLDTNGYGEYLADRLQHSDVEELLLQAELAVRLFRCEQGQFPTNLDELVPKYLASVPIDPLDPSRRPLRFRLEDDRLRVYSVGKDGVDDGGKFGTFRTFGQKGYDCDIETWLSP